jgi:4-azaleucine resistance transporter AzlC
MKVKALKAAFPFTIPVMIGYLFLGIGFGILLTGKGYPWWLSPLMALFIYAGSMQFVAIDIFSKAFNPLNALILTLTVNARHLFYGLSMLTKFKATDQKKPYLIFALTDETYSLLCSTEPPQGIDRNWFYFFITLLDQIYWVTGCTLGSVAGSLVKFNTTGIDFVMTALFVVIMVEQWESSKNHLPVLIGIGVSAICLLLFGKDLFILPSMISILAIVTIFRKSIERRNVI